MPTPVLFVDHANELGGAEHSLCLLIRHLDFSTWEPHVACPAGALAERVRDAGAIVHSTPSLTRLRSPFGAWRIARGVASLHAVASKARAALICSNTVRASVYAAVTARAAGLPHVWYVRDMPPAAAYAQFLASASRATIAVSGAVAARLPSRAAARVIPNGVDAAAFAPARAESFAARRRALGVPVDVPLISHVARLVPWKGQRAVIDAIERLAADSPTLHAVIAGGNILGSDERYVRELERRVTDAGLGRRVRLLGHIDNVADLLSVTDVVVHASDDEPFGRILIEAGAASVPVVAYDSGAASEIVVDGRTGLLVAPNPQALAAGLERLFGDDGLGRAMGARAHEHVVSHYDARGCSCAVEEVFREILPQARRGSPPESSRTLSRMRA